MVAVARREEDSSSKIFWVSTRSAYCLVNCSNSVPNLACSATRRASASWLRWADERGWMSEEVVVTVGVGVVVGWWVGWCGVASSSS